MRRVLVIAAAFAVVAGSASATDDASNSGTQIQARLLACSVREDPAIAGLRDCVSLGARRLEPSGESADNVATAAINSCSAAEDALRSTLLTCMPPDATQRVLNQIDGLSRDRAISIVVELRARRHSRR
jgi:hypothetical protein